MRNKPSSSCYRTVCHFFMCESQSYDCDIINCKLASCHLQRARTLYSGVFISLSDDCCTLYTAPFQCFFPFKIDTVLSLETYSVFGVSGFRHFTICFFFFFLRGGKIAFLLLSYTSWYLVLSKHRFILINLNLMK